VKYSGVWFDDFGGLKILMKMFLHAIESVAKAELRWALGKNGYAGLVPAKAQIGDVIVRLYQGCIDIVLRPQNEGYLYIGESSSHNFGPNVLVL
jgi:hypothetical protein